MRRLTILALLLAVAHPVLAVDRVTVQQLELEVAKLHGRRDASAAKQLFNLDLVERLTTARLRQLTIQLPGQRSQRALTALADRAAFLPLPASDVSAAAAPNAAMQKAMLANTAKYLANTIPKFPNFFATQETLRFAASSPPSKHAPQELGEEKLRFVDLETATASFTATKGESQASAASPSQSSPTAGTLAVAGVFGPIFAVAQRDILTAKPAWARWETGQDGAVAVFHYEVVRENSHYLVEGMGSEGRLGPAAYGGEIGLDPATGAILRITLEAVPRPDGLVKEANLLVEYGPVELGGRKYTCPLRSVAVSGARDLNPLQVLHRGNLEDEGTFKLEVNDMSYGEYHLFQSQMRVLSSGESGTGGMTLPPGSEMRPGPSEVQTPTEPKMPSEPQMPVDPQTPIRPQL
jgi:hypothetical protein